MRRDTGKTDGNSPRVLHAPQLPGAVSLLTGDSFTDVAQPPHTIQLGVSLTLMLKSFSLKPKLNLSCCYSTPLISTPLHDRQKKEIPLSFYVFEEYYFL